MKKKLWVQSPLKKPIAIWGERCVWSDCTKYSFQCFLTSHGTMDTCIYSFISKKKQKIEGSV